jgi:hypothetical protein
MATTGSAGSAGFVDSIKSSDAFFVNFVGLAVPAAEAVQNINPGTEQTSVTIYNFSDYDMVATVKGKDTAGAAVTLGTILIPGSNSTSSNSFESYRRSSGDLSQTIDSVDLVPIVRTAPPASGVSLASAAVAATLPTGVRAQAMLNFNNS